VEKSWLAFRRSLSPSVRFPPSPLSTNLPDQPPAPSEPRRNRAYQLGSGASEFANSVVERVEVGNGGESTVDEPKRRCVGMAEAKGATVVITFGDDRIERWTPIGKRYVVEHWFPASRLPVATPVVGIAERARD